MKTESSVFQTVGIIANPQKAMAARLRIRLSAWLRARKIRVLDSIRLSRERVVAHSDLIICLGGDGTLLSLAPLMEKRSVPVLGVNLGELGFLTEVKQNEVIQELSALLRGHYKIEERLMLSCTASQGKSSRTLQHFTALNDIVISREGLSRMLYVEVFVGGEKLTRFSGDGVVIATPTGSTAYSLSAGGAVVHPTLDALLITPICPHASALRSMVVSASDQITVRLKTKGGRLRALLTADGQKSMEIDDRFTVEVTHSKERLQLVKSSKRGYFATLREIFKFPA